MLIDNQRAAVAGESMTGMAEQPSILLILPYFGTLPTYADLFFRSCAANPSIHWLLITDQHVDERRLPHNVALKRTTFEALKGSIDDVVGFQTTLPTPYKLSDFRPAYGVIFAADASRFDFWGHCDMDLIFGDIRKFVTKEILQEYKKVLIHGHFSLYRNCEEANHYFELEAPGISFRDVFTSPQSRAFDEFGGIRPLLTHYGISFFRNDHYLADIDRNTYKLQTIQPPNYPHQCFYWERGKIFKEFWNGGGRARQEYLYIHLQKRPMSPPQADLADQHDAWYITPREFIGKKEDAKTPSEIDQLNPRNVLFDSKQYLLSSLWHLQHAMSQKVDPWPRRV